MRNPENKIDSLKFERSQIEGSIEDVNNHPDLTPEKKQSEINLLKSRQKVIQTAINKESLVLAIGGRQKLFDGIRQIQAGVPLAGYTMTDFEDMLSLQREIEKLPSASIAEDIKASNEAVKDFESQITKTYALMDEERKHILSLAESVFEEAPLYVAFTFPRLAAELIGEAPAYSPAVSGNSSVSVSASDNPDQKAMLSHINIDTVREAINNGVDAESNADILRWIAKNKLGKTILINQSLRTKVYYIREALGKVKPRK